jgi:hypothetical protein
LEGRGCSVVVGSLDVDVCFVGGRRSGDVGGVGDEVELPRRLCNPRSYSPCKGTRMYVTRHLHGYEIHNLPIHAIISQLRENE